MCLLLLILPFARTLSIDGFQRVKNAWRIPLKIPAATNTAGTVKGKLWDFMQSSCPQ